MQPLNPFLAAFSKSHLLSQCSPSRQHVLLVPCTDVLLDSRDAESGAPLTPASIGTDDFLGSHILRIPAPKPQPLPLPLPLPLPSHTSNHSAASSSAGSALASASASAPSSAAKDGPATAGTTQNLREIRGKPKIYNTINGRSIVIKDHVIYSNKGFRSLAQATLLHDAIWYPDTLDPKSFLIYYISRSLVGTWEEVKIVPAIPPPDNSYANSCPVNNSPEASSSRHRDSNNNGAAKPQQNGVASSRSDARADPLHLPRKKDIRNFHELLNHFPLIARQMQSGLEKLFREFTLMYERPLPPPPSAKHIPDPEPDGPIASAIKKVRSNSYGGASAPPMVGGGDGSAGGLGQVGGPPPVRNHSADFTEDDEDAMRASMETAVTTAIDIFQAVDKQQLSLLGATTDLTGPLVERLIERYVAENVHHLLFPRLSTLKRPEDLELEAKIRQMDTIDISQVGLAIEGGSRAKRDQVYRLSRAVDEFRKMSNAACPHDMMDILLTTAHITTQAAILSATRDLSASQSSEAAVAPLEKASTTVNADTLVSLLLYVVIRAQVKHLQARLSYIRHFIFIDDVDNGEMGYALSTFEAVLSYLDQDSGNLRRSSRRNRALWEVVTRGDMAELKNVMEPGTHIGSSSGNDERDKGCAVENLSTRSSRRPSSADAWSYANGSSSRRNSAALTLADTFSSGSGLRHVFPFQTNGDDGDDDDDDDDDDYGREVPILPVKRVRKVAMDTRSLSSSSEISFLSTAGSLATMGSSMEGDISIERLAQTQNSLGESVLMMAIQHNQPEALRYLLSLKEYYSAEVVLDDRNNEETTLLSAAVQLGHEKTINIVLAFLFGSTEQSLIRKYLAIQDTWGRSAAHYLFHAPFLIQRLGDMLPWRQRDRNGQTPLFALCRSYDHASYNTMVEDALDIAARSQADGEPLHLDEHVDIKGNTLLHIVSEAKLAVRILQRCDVDVNAINEKKFTPLMVASKYGRYEMVRVLFSDPRVDIAARELRGLTAVELAKDDDVRNRIDDLALFQIVPGPDARTTGVVRAYFVEDATIRFVLKSGAPIDDHSYAVTTCRRSLSDFELLVRLLAMENPASWIPPLAIADGGDGSSAGAEGAVNGASSGNNNNNNNNNSPHGPYALDGGSGSSASSLLGLGQHQLQPRSPTQVPSRPSRAVLRELRERVDWVLRVLLSHPTFSTHEMLWEFFLVPDALRPDEMEQRSRLKAETRAEKVRDELTPIADVREVEQFVDHARDMVRSVHFSTRSVARRTSVMGNVAADLYDASQLFAKAMSTLFFLPPSHISAFDIYVRSLCPSQSSPVVGFFASFLALYGNIEALLKALARPPHIIAQITSLRRDAERSGGYGQHYGAGHKENKENRDQRTATAFGVGTKRDSSTSKCSGGRNGIGNGMSGPASSGSGGSGTGGGSSSSGGGGTLGRASRWPLALLDDTRHRLQEEREERARRAATAAENLGKELRYTQQTVAAELAGWRDMHEKMARRAIGDLARGMVVSERTRLEGLQRALRRIRGTERKMENGARTGGGEG